MLLRFGFSNYRSILAYQELSLVASSLTDPGIDLIQLGREKDLRVLPSVGIYGANASGKSNILRGLRFIRNGVANSYASRKTAGSIQPHYFKFRSARTRLPSKFDVDFIKGDFHFHYGVIVDSTKVREEWLYAIPLGATRRSRQTWFHRKMAGRPEYYFGKELRGQNKIIAGLTSDSTLFLSTAGSNNHKQLAPVYEFFTDDLIFRDGDFEVTEDNIARSLLDKDKKRRILEFLRCADIGIADVDVVAGKKDKDQTAFMNELRTVIAKHAPQVEFPDDEDDNNYELRTRHRVGRKSTAPMEIEEESQGTVALLGILGPVFDCLYRGRVLIVDELNTSIHPLASRELIRLFGSAQSNKGRGQLVFSTHDTNLLCKGLLRRDQIWFTEKGGDAATTLYPLTDIRTRQTDNIERGYLEGRFGAIPFFGAHQLP